MKNTVSLKENHEFRRLYHRGTSSAGRHLVLYCRKNRLGHNRLGVTVSVKLGHAVVRNRARRRLREVYPHTLVLSFHQTLPSPSAILSQNPASLPPEELFDRFYQQVQQGELSEAQQKIVQSTLRQVSQELL